MAKWSFVCYLSSVHYSEAYIYIHVFFLSYDKKTGVARLTQKTTTYKADRAVGKTGTRLVWPCVGSFLFQVQINKVFLGNRVAGMRADTGALAKTGQTLPSMHL